MLSNTACNWGTRSRPQKQDFGSNQVAGEGTFPSTLVFLTLWFPLLRKDVSLLKCLVAP